MLFYRVSNHETQQGLWYDYKGNFTGLIHDKFNFCTNNKLPMPYDPNIVGWLSAAETLDELFNWFTPNDIKELEKHGYRIAIYEASEYKRYNNHWVIKQDNSRLVICVSLIKHEILNIEHNLLIDVSEKFKKTKTKKRFVLDIRQGCAAVIDTKHPYYMDNYPGIHPTTPHVIEFRHGIPNYELKRWEMRDSNIKFLTDYCASLNNE